MASSNANGDGGPRVVIAIDFGQTWSGYAHAFVRDRQVRMRENWPEQDSPYVKTRTALLYHKDGTEKVLGWGTAAVRQAYQLYREEGASKKYALLAYFKMWLRSGQRGTDGPVFRADGQDHSVIDLIAHFLRALKDEALQEVRNSVTGTLDEREVAWCLTVPAIWTNEEKHWMRKAARRAGVIGEGQSENERLSIVLEPEAAALYCQQEDANTGLTQLHPGTTLMIADAGGGTVDVTLHRVGADGRLEELITGEGNDQGSHNINRQFGALVEQLLTRAAVEQFRQDNPIAWQKLLEYFEVAKCAYKPAARAADRYVYVTMPGELVAFLRERHPDVCRELQARQGVFSEIRLERAQMDQLFRKPIGDAVALVSSQLAKVSGGRCDFLFLVGGFAGSKMLEGALRQAFEGPQVGRVVVPYYPGRAVLRGAVLYGLAPQSISVRTMRRTYGLQVLAPFEPGDPPEKRIPAKGPGDWDRCPGRFLPFVQVGQQVGYNEKVTHRLSVLPEQKTKRRVAIVSSPRPNVRYTWEEDARVEFVLYIEVPSRHGGKRPDIEVNMYFGRTEIYVEVIDLERPDEPGTATVSFE